MTGDHDPRVVQPGEVVRTKSGKVLTDADMQRLADEAEAGYDVGKLLAARPRDGHAITLPLDDWSHVLSGLIRAYQSNLPAAERQHYRRVGRTLAQACPQDSAAWWGAAGFGGDDG